MTSMCLSLIFTLQTVDVPHLVDDSCGSSSDAQQAQDVLRVRPTVDDGFVSVDHLAFVPSRFFSWESTCLAVGSVIGRRILPLVSFCQNEMVPVCSRPRTCRGRARLEQLDRAADRR